MSKAPAQTRRDYSDEIDELGFALVSDVVSDRRITELTTDLTQLSTEQNSRRRKMYAVRNLLGVVPSIARLSASRELRSLVEPMLGESCFPVRGILFDKVDGANWLVGWHQDQIIPVAERRETVGFSAWSIKENVPHVRPPVLILERMLTLRIHLDNCSRQNGALKVIPGSHRSGFLNELQVNEFVVNAEPIVIEAPRGSVLAMRPLLLHASAPSENPSHRRVIHLEFAVDPLPGDLQWPSL